MAYVDNTDVSMVDPEKVRILACLKNPRANPFSETLAFSAMRPSTTSNRLIGI